AGRNGGASALQKVLVDSEGLAGGSDEALKMPRDLVELRGVPALVVDAGCGEDGHQVAGLGGERAAGHRRVEIDQRVERSGFGVILENPAQVYHCSSFQPAISRLSGS